MVTRVAPEAIIYPGVELGEGSLVEPFCVLGSLDCTPTVIGPGAVIRSGTRIYGGVEVGEDFQTGHFSLVRGHVHIGNNVRLGSYSSVEGFVTIGDGTRIRGRCEIPNSWIGSGVEIYAGVMFYDTPNPPDGPNKPPMIQDDVVLCYNAAVLGGVIVGADSMVAANAIVTHDVPVRSFVKRSGEIVPRR